MIYIYIYDIYDGQIYVKRSNAAVVYHEMSSV